MRSADERQAEVEQRGLVWHRCTSEIERVRLQLRRAGSDRAACGQAAREGAAVLAAWSLELERDQPGALARASRQLARSAELPAPTPASRRPVSRASGLGLISGGERQSAQGRRGPCGDRILPPNARCALVLVRISTAPMADLSVSAERVGACATPCKYRESPLSADRSTRRSIHQQMPRRRASPGRLMIESSAAPHGELFERIGIGGGIGGRGKS